MSDVLDDLDPEVRELIEPHMPADPVMLDAIGTAIAEKRDEAKAARHSSGIESMWRDCEEAYIGIDAANRGEYPGGKWEKPQSLNGPVSAGGPPAGTNTQSTAFVRLTARYVDAGSAKLGEILLPADDKAFSFTETPDPDLIAGQKDFRQVVHNGMPLTRPLKQGETPHPSMIVPPTPAAPPAAPLMLAGPPNAPGTPPPPPAPGAAPAPLQPIPDAQPPPSPRVKLTAADLATEKIELAREKAKRAETRIYDWMVECQYAAEMRKVIFDAARIGVGVLKAPVPKNKRSVVVQKGGDGVNVEMRDKISPVAEWVDPWNIFPAPGCGENIHNGDFILERDFMSVSQVRDLKKLPGYIKDAIDRVLKEGPEKVNQDEDGVPRDPLNANKNKDRFSVWYFYGTLTREEMGTICKAAGTDPDTGDGDEVYAIVTLINDSVVRATINPLLSGRFPYHSVPWQRRSQHWAGIGVAEQMKMPQAMTNASLRAMLNNAGKSAGCQFVINQSAFRPADGDWTITPDKIWLSTTDFEGDAREAFLAIVIPNVTEQMMQIITLGERFAEESTSIPLITQGQSGATTPDTFGAAQLQNNNANQLLRSIGYAFDDFITEPVVRQFYEYMLIDPDVPDDEKGDYNINAHGSVALVERAIQNQTIGQLLPVSKDPAYGLNPKKTMALYLKSQKLDPAEVQYTEEEQQKIDAAGQPVAPAVQVAQINSDTQLKLGVMQQTSDQQTAQAEGQIAAAAHTLEVGRVQVDQQATHLDATLRAHEIEQRLQIAQLDYASKHGITLDQVKASLAKTAMELNTERELNAQNQAAELHKHGLSVAVDLHKHHNPPPVQVPGRAANGQSFSQAAT